MPHAEAVLRYPELAAQAEDLAARLARLGVAPGDALALWAPNQPAWAALALAAWRLGAVLVPLPPRWTDAEAGPVLARARPRLVVGGGDEAARAAALGHPASTFAALAAAPLGAPPPAPPAGRLAAVVPTSGTTGAPKLACLTMAGLAATAAATAGRLALGPADIWWLPLPLHHVGGLGALARAWHAGAGLWLAAKPEPAALAAVAPTHASLVPTLLLDLADRPWPPSLRAAMVGGAAPPPDLAARCPAAWGTYGLTEAGGTVTLGPAGPGGDSGPALPGWAIGIRDEAGRPVPVGQEGAIAVRGPGLMAGYLDDPAATAAALDGGWLRTGDLGRLDAEGRLTVLARRTDLVVRGGENVYPAEVEAALRAHPAVLDAAVVPAPDPRLGQVPIAFLVPRDPAGTPDLAALRAFLDGRLARFKHPEAVEWLPALPRLAAGKVDRRALRDRV